MSIRRKLRTVDPVAVVGSEEGHHASDILWHSAALERAVLGHQLLDLVRWPLWGATWDLSKNISIVSYV